ncbi:Nitric oxide-responding transcriptional regulator Dnr (Crp/Fnr family) [hydrothermal vent metagenome]|uniref:Nitric oxide-responding transcriptional regulator Dnr (Crp/Fnr family) n=1 Tax=hydrothermal vent metagenome TaxID=652676 RepID=A0A1W1BA44_9ZZZZ
MKRLNSTVIIIFFLTNILFSKAVIADVQDVELINIVNQQRMLSQRIAKAYLYAGNRIEIDDANRQLREALKDFKRTYKRINSLTNNPKIKKIMSFIEQSSGDFKTISKKPLTKESAKSILKLSESVLGRSENIASLFKQSLKKDAFESITKSGQQQMLAQRIAKYYIAYQSDIKDSNIQKKMRESINLFTKNHKKLMKNRANTKAIKRKLKEIDRLWKIAHKLYKGKEHSLIVFGTTDDISRKMAEVTKLYIATYK